MSSNRMPNALYSTLEAVERSLPTSGAAVSRLRASLSSRDPLDLVRKIVQKDLNQKIDSLFQEYIRMYFQPAAKNVEANLGMDTSELLEQTCINALEHAKVLFRGKGQALKRRQPPVEETSRAEKKIRMASPPSLVPRNPIWNAERLNAQTLFVLGAKAHTALGLPPGKLYVKYPEVVKYPADQEDKEWLARELLISSTGGKAFLLVLEDVLSVSGAVSELTTSGGFTLPDFMIEKIKTFMRDKPKEVTGASSSEVVGGLLLNDSELKSTEGGSSGPSAAPVENVEDELGFLHGMNLTSLVREFEMEAGAGSQHLGILSLADDTESFSELTHEVQENMESFGNIEFH